MTSFSLMTSMESISTLNYVIKIKTKHLFSLYLHLILKHNRMSFGKNTRTRYGCPWDCSNQYKQYSYDEIKFIRRCLHKGISEEQIAKRLRRGLWAIQVQIKNMQQCRNKSASSTKPLNAKQRKETLQLIQALKNRQQAKHMQSKQVHTQQSRRPRLQKRQGKKMNTSSKFRSEIKMCAHQNRKFGGKKFIVETTQKELEDELKNLLGLWRKNVAAKSILTLTVSTLIFFSSLLALQKD